MKKFVLITLAIVIIYLVWKNTDALSTILKSVTGMFNNSFKSVTEVGDFK